MDIKNSSESELIIASALNTIALNCLLNLSHTLFLCKLSENYTLLVEIRMVQRNSNEIL